MSPHPNPLPKERGKLCNNKNGKPERIGMSIYCPRNFRQEIFLFEGCKPEFKILGNERLQVNNEWKSSSGSFFAQRFFAPKKRILRTGGAKRTR